MKKFIVLLVVFFLGFLTHAFFFPNFLYRGLTRINLNNIASTTSPNDVNTTSSSFSYVDFDGKEFNPPIANVNFGQYIAVTNKSVEKKMWLVSDNKMLSTVRPYSYLERLAVILPQEGTYQITDKDTGAKLTVVVKKVKF